MVVTLEKSAEFFYESVESGRLELYSVENSTDAEWTFGIHIHDFDTYDGFPLLYYSFVVITQCMGMPI